MPNYYNVLGVEQTATTEEIRGGFRKKALKWHPKRNRDNVDVAPQKFAEITAAYEILNDAQLRAIYDKYGQDGLDNGIPGETNSFRFQASDPEKVFFQFFGTQNPFDCFFEDNKDDAQRDKEGEDDFYTATYGPRSQGTLRQPGQVVEVVNVPLNEFYNGAKRRVQMLVKRRDPDTGAISEQPKDFTFDIKPGMKGDERIRFEKAHHEGPGIIPADVVVAIQETEANGFTRREKTFDLCYKAPIALATALCGGHAVVPTLDGRQLNIPVNKVVDQFTVTVVKGEGLPYQKEGKKVKGDLHLTYAIVFPKSITPEDKDTMAGILEQYEDE